MIQVSNAAELAAVTATVREAYMEVFPSATIADRLDALEPGAFVAVTCSPSKGVDETLRLTAELTGRGFRVCPHIAARSVRGAAHLREIMAKLEDLPVESVFVPGGDASSPAGEFATAFDLLRAMAEFDHRFKDIGIAAHPEGHPEVSAETLMRELERKQPFATYLVTQMCFGAVLLGEWLRAVRERGIDLPAWIGIPGVCDRSALVRTSLRIGVGDSLRFLRRSARAASELMRKSSYTPDGLLSGLAPLLATPSHRIDGCHIFCFNQVETTEAWRRRTLAELVEAGRLSGGIS